MNSNVSFERMIQITQELKKKKEYHDSLLNKPGTDAERQQLTQQMQDLLASMKK